jgi:hypothetical protein
MIKKINDRSLSSSLELEKASLEEKLKNAQLRIAGLEKALTQKGKSIPEAAPEPEIIEKRVEVEVEKPAVVERIQLLKVGDADKSAKPPEVMCTVQVNGEEDEQEIILALTPNVSNRLRTALRNS